MDFEFWFYSYFWDDFGSDYRMVLCHVFGMFGAVFVACFVASIRRILWPMDKGCFGMVSGQKLACIGAAKELFGTPVCESHSIAWLGSILQPSGTQLCGFPSNCVDPASSGTLLRGFPSNRVAPAHLQTSNFERP